MDRQFTDGSQLVVQSAANDDNSADGCSRLQDLVLTVAKSTVET
jgi:hypothetical protein